MMLMAVASAAHAESRQKIDLPAGRLGSAIVALGRQAGISIGVSDPGLAALRVRAVKGDLTVRQALARMLQGSGAGYIDLGDRGWRIVRLRVPAPARTSAEPAADETDTTPLIVTGSKRRTLLADYPGSASILRMDDLPAGSAGQGSGAILARLPGVTSTHLGSGRNQLFLRGIADSSFNGPTQATVGQYLGETRLNYNAPDPDLRLYDIATIEVLQGPQGTLHGAGSLGGVLRILPVTPRLDEIQASVAGSAAATAHGAPSADLSGMINLPLVTDKLALRAVAYGIRDGGYIDDSLRGLKDVNRTDTFGGRAALRAEPGPGWTIDLGATFQSIDGRDSQYADRDAPDLTKASPVAQDFSNDYALGQLVIRKQWDGLSLVSATGMVHQDISETYDATLPGVAPSLFHQRNRITLLSNENRLSRDLENGIGWVIGTSLVSNRYRLNRRTGPVTTTRALAGIENGVDEATLFGEMTVALTNALKLTGGGRITYARLSGEALDAPVLTSLARMSARRGETTILPSLGMTVAALPGLTLFARYQEGFRPGGIAVRNESVQRYRNDDVTSIEAGLRYGGEEAGIGDFDAALSIAHTRWRDIQADLTDSAGLPATVNIGDGRIWTIDAALGWRPFPGLRLEASGVFADSRLTSPAVAVVVLRSRLPANSAAGPVFGTAVVAESDALPNVARINARIGADYGAWLGGGYDLRLSAWARYVGRSRLGIGPVLGVIQGDYLDTALSARVGKGRAGLFLSATNLFDTIGNRFALGSPFTLPYVAQITPLRPRTIRIGMDMRF